MDWGREGGKRGEGSDPWSLLGGEGEMGEVRRGFEWVLVGWDSVVIVVVVVLVVVGTSRCNGFW